MHIVFFVPWFVFASIAARVTARTHSVKRALTTCGVCCSALWLLTSPSAVADAPAGNLPKPGIERTGKTARITSVTPAYGTDGEVTIRGNVRLDKVSAVVWGGRRSTLFSAQHDGSLRATPLMPFWGTGKGPWTVPVTVILSNAVLPTDALFTAPVEAVRVTVPEPVQPPGGGPEYVDTFWRGGGGHSFLLGPVAGAQLITEPKDATFYVDTIVSNSDLPYSQKLGDLGQGAEFRATLFMCDIGNDVAQQRKNGASACRNWDGYSGVWVEAKCAKVSWSGPAMYAGWGQIYLDNAGSSKFAASKQGRYTFDAAACFDQENLARTFSYRMDTGVLQRGAVAFPSRGASQNSPTFDIVVGPAAFLETSVLPYSILFQPPGDQSTVSFTATKTFGTQFSLGKSKTIDNKSTTSQSSSLSFAESVAFILGYGGGVNDQTSQTTLQDFGTVGGQGTQGASSVAFSTTFSLGTDTSLVPGSGEICTSTAVSICASTSEAPEMYANEPFWNDVFLLFVRPQFAIWVIGGKADRYQLYGAVPVIGQIPVAALDACATGNTTRWGNINPCDIHTSGAALTSNKDRDIVSRGEKLPIRLSAAQAKHLLTLDPFYAGGQGADIRPSRGNLIYEGQYGATAGADPVSVTTTLTNAMQTQSNQNGQTTYTSDISNVTGESNSFGLNVSLSLGATEGATEGTDTTPPSSGGFGGTGQTVGASETLTIGSQQQTSTESDMTLSYQNSTAVSKQVVTMAAVTLNDLSNCPVTSPPSPPCHGPLKTQPSVNVYFDRVFGGFMFQDPYAPKVNAHEKALPCCTTLVRTLAQQERNDPRFSDVPSSNPDAGAIGLLARAGVLPGKADGTFGPNRPFTRDQLLAAVEQAAHLSANAAQAALGSIAPSNTITEAALTDALARAGLISSTTSLPRSAGPLTRAEAAHLIFLALENR